MNKPASKPDIRSFLERLPSAKTYWVSYSGGADSTALLHLLVAEQENISSSLKAVHVDHGLHSDSRKWTEHCREQCRRLAVDLEVIAIDAGSPAGESPEAYARRLRYEAISELMQDNDILFTAHHVEDQAETMLLQLVRGAGPEGLASMPELRRMKTGWLARPLLCCSKQELIDYNRQNKLEWIEDDSNQDTGFDRNYLRQVILPEMRTRWPAVMQTLARSARLQAELMQVARETAEVDAANAIDEEDSGILHINSLLALSEPRQKNLLRYWIRFNRYPLPGSDLLNRILTEVIGARADASPCLQWSGSELRRHGNRLYLMQTLPAIDSDMVLEWNLDSPLQLPHGYLRAEKCSGAGIAARCLDGRNLTVSFRHGGESIRIDNNTGRQTLKKLFQQVDMPAWLRDQWPLLQINGDLAAVASYWVDTRYRAKQDEPGWKITFCMNQTVGNNPT